MSTDPPPFAATVLDGGHLDATQYRPEAIEKYEAIYGRNFVSPGGLESARDCIGRLGLQQGMHVLDLGCGLGGSAFYMAREYGVHVLGIDLSINMIEGARQRLGNEQLERLVTLEWQDAMTLDMTQHAGRYQVVYSRDAFLHIHGKARLFERLRQLLSSGGLLFFTDYCCGESPASPAFAAYIQDRQYDLRTVRQYQRLLEDAGFAQAHAEDHTAKFINILDAELSRIDTDEAHADLRQSWIDKIGRARSGEQGWCWGEGRRLK